MDKYDKDLVPLREGEAPVYCYGWDNLEEQSDKNTLAYTFRALAILERDYIHKNGLVHTQIKILNEAIALGAKLSPKSQRIVHSNLEKLIELGFVRRPEGYEKRNRGGATAPWRTKIVWKTPR
jgi:hypothetical protein